MIIGGITKSSFDKRCKIVGIPSVNGKGPIYYSWGLP